MELQEGLGLVRGDEGALGHALMNLCVNAVDAMPGGGTLRIMTCRLPDGVVAVRVRDTGGGMSAEVLAKAMEPFFTTKPVGKGTGLGLSMVYGTMRAHEGALELTSEIGKGTEAVLIFPASRISQPLPVPSAPSELQVALTAMDILLVDDDELILESMAEILEGFGHRLVLARDGAEAIHLLETDLRADVVILDMNMPGMNGAQTLPLILDLRPGLAVLMVTGYSDYEIAPLIAGRPNVQSLRKPFAIKELQVKLAELMTARLQEPSYPVARALSGNHEPKAN
jgi:CheY-like chemotaxis protein